MMHGLFLLMRTEFKILARDRSAMMMSLVMPLLMGAFFGFSFSSFDADDGTGSLVGVWPAIAVQVVIMLGFAIYIRSTVMMTSRRQSLFLKRLRSSEIGDSTILAGLITPVLIIGLLQIAVIATATMVAAGSTPEHFIFLLIAIPLALALFATAAILTASFTQSSENAQLTTALPFFVITGATMWVLFTEAPATVTQLLLPAAGIAELVRLAWATDMTGGEMWTAAIRDSASTVAWTAIFVTFARRYFRWERRGAG